MTSTVTDVTTTILRSSSYDALSTTIGLALMLALVILLFQHEVTNVLGGFRANRWAWAFDIALVPLLFVFLLIVAARLIELIV
jgi:hypothetical protein